jgi:predicted O-methyltransferase YrrM
VDARPHERPHQLVSAEVKPDFYPTDEQLEYATGLLAAAYDEYTRTVSDKGMAIGLPSAAFIYVLCDTLQPARMVDFGSGFTSYLLRLFPGDVISVDDDPEWLDKTRLFLDKYEVSTDGLQLIDEFRPARFDLILYDYAGGETRNRKYGWVTDMLNPGGVIFYDDAHHDGHRSYMMQACETRHMGLWRAQETTDTYGRFGALGWR